MTGRAAVQGQEKQRRQTELVDQLGLVSIAEIADIFRMRQIGFRQQNNTRRDIIDHRPQQSDDLVGLRQIDARGADFLPEIGDSVQTDNPGAVSNIAQHNIEKFKKDVGIGHIQIHLVGAEGRPDMPFTGNGVNLCHKRAGPGTDHGGKICLRIDFNKIIPGRGDGSHIILKPF